MFDCQSCKSRDDPNEPWLKADHLKQNGRIDLAYLLRTYDHHYASIPNWLKCYNSGADPLKIWQVTRATSAAPFYFDELKVWIYNEEWIFKDGGIRENNPSEAAYTEFISLYGSRKKPACLLSVGTGRPNEAQDGFATVWPGPLGKLSFLQKLSEKIAILRNLLIKYTEGEQKHRQMVCENNPKRTPVGFCLDRINLAAELTQ